MKMNMARYSILNSFQNNLCRLPRKLTFQKDILPWTRQQGLVWVKVYKNDGNFEIRCIEEVKDRNIRDFYQFSSSNSVWVPKRLTQGQSDGDGS